MVSVGDNLPLAHYKKVSPPSIFWQNNSNGFYS